MFYVSSFRWPRTLAGITADLSCHTLRYPALAIGGEEKKALRYCDRLGHWEDGDYTQCHYTNDITRVLHTFIQVGAVPFSLHRSSSVPLKGRCTYSQPK